MNWLTILILILLLAAAVIGYRRGFMKMVLSFLSILLAVVLTLVIAPRVRDVFCDRTTVDDRMADKFYELMVESGMEATGGVIPQGTPASAATEEDLKDLLNGLKLPAFLTEALGKAADTMAVTLEAQVRGMAEKAARLILSVIFYSVIFLILLLIFLVVSAILCKVAKLPVLKQMNGLLGLLISLLEAFLVLDLFLLLVSVLKGEAGELLRSQIEESPALCFFRDNNLVRLFFRKLFEKGKLV